MLLLNIVTLSPDIQMLLPIIQILLLNIVMLLLTFRHNLRLFRYYNQPTLLLAFFCTRLSQFPLYALAPQPLKIMHLNLLSQLHNLSRFMQHYFKYFCKR